MQYCSSLRRQQQLLYVASLQRTIWSRVSSCSRGVKINLRRWVTMAGSESDAGLARMRQPCHAVSIALLRSQEKTRPPLEPQPSPVPIKRGWDLVVADLGDVHAAEQ